MLPAAFLCYPILLANATFCFSCYMCGFLPFFSVYTNYLLLLGFVVVLGPSFSTQRPCGCCIHPPSSRTRHCSWKVFAPSAIKMHPGLLIGKGKSNMWLTQTFTGLRNWRAGYHSVLKSWHLQQHNRNVRLVLLSSAQIWIWLIRTLRKWKQKALYLLFNTKHFETLCHYQSNISICINTAWTD